LGTHQQSRCCTFVQHLDFKRPDHSLSYSLRLCFQFFFFFLFLTPQSSVLIDLQSTKKTFFFK
jgi:hypothetical protein